MNKILDDFIFGVATSSYQIEGTHNNFESIWDTFAKKEGTVIDGTDGTVACDHEHLYKKDVEIIKNLGVDSYRFSISWARIIPRKGYVSEEGIKFYIDLFEELKSKNIKPSVTLYHWDMPQWCYEEGSDWRSERVLKYFLEYCEVCFKNFDKYVINWVTFNEPFCVTVMGYFYGGHAPGHKNINDLAMAVHTVFLCHTKAVKMYRKNYNSKPIGIVLNLIPVYSKINDELQKVARKNADMFINDLFLSMTFNGKYPAMYLEMLKKQNVDTTYLLDEYDADIDFLGVNYYNHMFVKYDKHSPMKNTRDTTDYPKSDMGWDINPEGLRDLLYDVRKRYGYDTPIFITENGAATADKIKDGIIQDDIRIKYLKDHLKIIDEVKDELNIKGYYLWSLMDNYEWAFGYTKRFGIVYVDYDNLKRTPKQSYYWYQEYIKKQKLIMKNKGDK